MTGYFSVGDDLNTIGPGAALESHPKRCRIEYPLQALQGTVADVLVRVEADNVECLSGRGFINTANEFKSSATALIAGQKR